MLWTYYFDCFLPRQIIKISLYILVGFLLFIGFFSSRKMMFLLALRKEPSCIYTACICWRFKIFKAFLVPLDLAPNFINLYPSYPYQMHHTFFIFYLALAARYFIPFNFYFFFTSIFQLPWHRHYLNFKVFFMYEISFHFLNRCHGWQLKGGGRKRKDRNSELHLQMQLSFVSQKWQVRQRKLKPMSPDKV